MRSFQATAMVALTALTLAAAQNATVNLFIIDNFDGNAGYQASIVSACGDATVYAVQCTSGPASASPSTCGPAAPTLTLTEGPSVYIASSVSLIESNGETVTATIAESCALKGTTAANCKAAVTLSAQGQETSSTTALTISGTNYHRFDVPITAGAAKTATATGKCTSGAMHTADSRGVLAMAVAGALGLAGVLLM
ncbi:hypothetical protein F5884DRAFT_903908 [Xylogone sp. PMI_703]|nr:hypothetical protein F5884DRAFT_903908 [Xylogone sp. PMI_703]